MPFRLITGRGCVAAHSGAFAKLGDKCLIVTSGSAAKKSGALNDVIAALEKEHIAWTLYDQVKPNPLLVDCKAAGEQGRAFGAAFVVGIGGGSPLDAAKAAAVFAANDIEPMEIYSLDWKNPALPLVLVGTTAGTGSEVAPFSVLTKPDGRKKSIGSEQCYATVAFGDAAYTDSLPRHFTVSCALDALSHAVEAYFCTSGNEMSDLYALEAARILLPDLAALRSIRDAADIQPEMRERLYYASVLAGFALAKCGTCYCHSLGYFLSEEHGVAHGMACAATLPDFLRRAGRLVVGKPERLRAVTGNSCEKIAALVEQLAELPKIELTAAQIAEIADRYDGSPNYKRTAPEGYSRGEAVELLTKLYAGR